MEAPGYAFDTLDAGGNIDDRVKELVSAQGYIRQEICSALGVPLPLINGTYQNNLEEIYVAFLSEAIAPLSEQIEASFNKSLLGASGMMSFIIQFDYESLRKTSYKTQVENAKAKIEMGVWNPNQAKDALGTGTWTQDGENYFVSANLKSINDPAFIAGPDTIKK